MDNPGHHKKKLRTFSHDFQQTLRSAYLNMETAQPLHREGQPKLRNQIINTWNPCKQVRLPLS